MVFTRALLVSTREWRPRYSDEGSLSCNPETLLGMPTETRFSWNSLLPPRWMIPHTSTKTVTWLRETVEGWPISLKDQHEWALHSLDLNPLYYFPVGIFEGQSLLEQSSYKRQAEGKHHRCFETGGSRNVPESPTELLVARPKMSVCGRLSYWACHENTPVWCVLEHRNMFNQFCLI